jgi:hypothetical protein
MKRKLLLALMALPFFCKAQVANPEGVYAALPQTGFTATVDTYQGPNPASLAVDGNTATYWEAQYSPMTNLPHWIKVDMQSSQTIGAVYIVDRDNLGNSIRSCTVSTSPDGTTWTQQGGTFTLPYNGSFGKIYMGFPGTVTCRYYRIDITANQASGNQVSNVAETGAATKTVLDVTAYDRSGWTVSASSQELSGEGTTNGRAAVTIDRDASTFWASTWSGTAAPYPHTLVYDMKQAQAVNRLYYIQRDQRNSNAVEGSVSFSDDGTNFGTEIPVTFVTNTSKNFIDLPSLQYHRYFRMTITKNYFALANPTQTGNASYYATTMAEVGANLNTSLSNFGLLYFKALDLNSTAVRMDWSTQFENGNSRFDITRSTDGLNFTTIGSVNAAGTSTSQLKYNFTDNTAPAGTNYYQLQSVNSLGLVTKSDIVSVVSGTTYSSSQPANLNLIYFVPNDVDYIPDYQKRLNDLMLWGQDWYGKNMEKNGYGYKPFGLFKNAAGDRIKITTIFGTKSKASYAYSGGAGNMQSEINAYFAAHPGEKTSEHTLVLIPRYGYQPDGVTPDGGPFYGLGKWCFALDYEEMDIKNLGKSDAVGNRFSVWYGGMMHELGHGLNLPHNRQKKSETADFNKGMALMWAGNGTLGKSPTFLTAADCAILNGNQIFNNNTNTYYGAANLRLTNFHANYSTTKNAIVISGKFVSDVPANDVTYYNDPNVNNEGVGGNRDYNAITWASHVTNGDSFYVEEPVNEFVVDDQTTINYTYELKLRIVHTNGTITEIIFPYQFVNSLPVINYEYDEKKELGKHGWTVAGFSSEETEGEGPVNGHAAALIDSNPNTYWHSMWSIDPAAVYPHYVTIDMSRTQEVKGLSLIQRPGLQRAVKDFEILSSTDGISFTSQGNFVAQQSNLRQYFDFPSLQTFRYFKVIAKSAWDGEQFAALAELGLYHDGNYAPTFTAPSDVTVYKNTDCNYNATTAITGKTSNVFDDYTENPVVVFTDAITAGSNEDEKIITRTWKATDTEGLFTEKVQLITVKDNTAPIISGTTTVGLGYEINGSYSIPPVTVSDNCSINTITYQVTGATTQSGTGTNASGSFNPGVSVIEWTATDKSGNATTFQTTVTVNALSGNIADVYAVNPGGNANTIYLGYGPSSLTLTAQVSGGTAPYSYSWSNGSSTGSTTINPSQAGTYSYTVTITDAAGSTISLTKMVTVTDIRSGKNKVTICHKNGNSLSINVSDVANHIAHGDKLGNCDANVTASAKGLQADQKTITLQEFTVQAYPNPSSSDFSLSISSDVQQPVNVRVFDLSGKLLRAIKTTTGITKLGNELNSGTYIVEITQDNNTKIIKLIKL